MKEEMSVQRAAAILILIVLGGIAVAYITAGNFNSKTGEEIATSSPDTSISP